MGDFVSPFVSSDVETPCAISLDTARDERVLEVNGLTLANRLSGVSAMVRPGEVTAICGPNGAGKSSLLSCLAGLLHGDSGAALLDGIPLASMPPRARAQAIGYLPQSAEVAWDVSVEVLAGLGRLPWPEDGGDAAIDNALAAMDLIPLRRRPLSTLSGGERARALMARVLAGEPRWILADEPLANLDLGHAQNLMRSLRDQALRDQAGSGVGVVLVLHDLASAMNHADRVLVLDHGMLVADGAPEEALAEAVIARVWGVQAQWLGDVGARGLGVG